MRGNCIIYISIEHKSSERRILKINSQLNLIIEYYIIFFLLFLFKWKVLTSFWLCIFHAHCKVAVKTAVKVRASFNQQHYYCLYKDFFVNHSFNHSLVMFSLSNEVIF